MNIFRHHLVVHCYGATQEDILHWIIEVAIPEYDALDDAFRVNQRIWIKEVG